MSEEEILDKLRKMLYHTQKANECGLSNNDFKEDIEAIEGILDLYQKEKEKNKELSEKITENICNRVEAEVLEEYRLKVKNSISKDKIRELIDKRGNNEYTSLDCIEDIEELLEERN